MRLKNKKKYYNHSMLYFKSTMINIHKHNKIMIANCKMKSLK